MKVRSHPEATTDDFIDYVWPTVRKKPNLIITQTGTNDIKNNVNTLQKIRKAISSIKEHDTDDNIKITLSSIIHRSDHDFENKINETNSRRGELLVYIKSPLPSKMLTKFKLPNNIQVIPFVLNLRKDKWLFVSIYKSPLQNNQHFVNILNDLLDFYSNGYDNKVVSGDFNLDLLSPSISSFINSKKFVSLVKNKTCFKGTGSCIDLILKNGKYSFKILLTKLGFVIIII